MASRRIEDCVPPLAAAWEALAKAFHEEYVGWKAVVVCTHRPPEEQFEIFKKGRKLSNGRWVIEDEAKVLTLKDGFKLRGRHNDFPARALDIEVYSPDNRKYWDTVSSVEKGTLINPWLWLLDAAPRYGLVNGGSWATLQDWPHFQLS